MPVFAVMMGVMLGWTAGMANGASASGLVAHEQPPAPKNPELEKLLDAIEAAGKAKKYEEVLKLTAKAAALDPKNPAIPYAAGVAHAGLRQHAEAVKAFSEVIQLEPQAAIAYDRRGDAYLKLGRFTEAIADFDAYLKARPQDKPEHWRRGIALYYAGRFPEGVEQFELHRTVNPEDVENSVWHYLCNARAHNRQKARQQLIPVTQDDRVPMKQVLELFAGKIQPQDVLEAVEKAALKDDKLREARFYGHLYVALYYDSEGDTQKSREHLTTAVEKYKIGHYMWDVAAVHLQLLKDKKK
ncbi:MAG: tetratricopeptide repeat protein [Gemmataceae bacterium]|nr:tetratricopeptide repeat protein [Gemmata sp.]MDW8197343.1 tetratricopeptide repeat protein [Gemmataceae bacterium]